MIKTTMALVGSVFGGRGVCVCARALFAIHFFFCMLFVPIDDLSDCL